LRIECYDISNLQGNQVVGSMVVFEDGLPRKSEYRRFEVRGVDGQDDVASLREVLSRRLARLAAEGTGPGPGESAAGKAQKGKFAYPPNLIVVDGGRSQLAAALDAVEATGRPDLAVISLAKRMEEIYLPGQPEPVVLPRTSEALYLLQRVRDEAHRFAITYHRTLRRKSMTRSVLDGIPGVGETRRKLLVRHFGSARRAAQASLEELEEVQGLGPQLARTIWSHLHAAPQPEAARATVAGSPEKGDGA
jgi:excinuclease ABC subunit C